MTSNSKFPYPTFGISEWAVRDILLGNQRPLNLSDEVKRLPIDIISEKDGRVLATLEPK